MSKKYIIDEEDLLDYMEAAYKCWALETGGVDNWGWCSESCRDWFKSATEDLSPEKFEAFKASDPNLADLELGELDFRDFAKMDIPTLFKEYDPNPKHLATFEIPQIKEMIT